MDENKETGTTTIGRPASTVLLVLVILWVLVFLWFGVRWQIGNMFAELTSVNQPDAGAIADMAISLAPGDPAAHWLKATTEKNEFTFEGIVRAVELLEEVVRRSPHDFRWWIELGRAYEQAERMEAAEWALLRAIELAPEYTFPKWQLGNFYLRRGRTEQAFAELMKTTQQSSVYREQVFSLAWDYFENDARQVEAIAGDAPDMRLSLAMFFAQRGAAADALRNWNMLSEEQKAADPRLPRIMAQGLFDRRSFRESVEFARQSGQDPESSVGSISNGGFERPIGNADETLFGWRIIRGEARLDVSIDSQTRHEGARSLRVTFRGYAKPELYNVVQIVAVKPSTAYRLSFWVRTENLRSGGPPLIQVGNANDDSVLVASQPFDGGTADWKQITLEFQTPDNCEGLAIRTGRIYCGDECPITGTLWYDEFQLTER